MARESCNLDKDEAEIIKPTSSPPPPSSNSPPPPPSPLFIKPSQEFPASSDSPAPPKVGSFELQNEAQASHTATENPLAAVVDGPTAEAAENYVNRCSSCRKRVGLTGFRCRCGQLFCPCHRYSETHDCSFDYKVVGRAEIAKANPVVRAAKIIKI